MRHAATIRARMIEDLRVVADAIESRRSEACEDHLKTLGWTGYQIIDHAPRAIEEFRRP